jgi:hypothetical protein
VRPECTLRAARPITLHSGSWQWTGDSIHDAGIYRQTSLVGLRLEEHRGKGSELSAPERIGMGKTFTLNIGHFYLPVIQEVLELAR